MNIYASNLDIHLESEDLKKLFTPYGEVGSAEIVKDVFTDQSRGFGFVEMPNQEEAEQAIAALDKSDSNGRIISVKQAEPKKEHKGSYKVGSGAVNVYRFKKN
jgi:RNA recognition motif-containing protein